MTARVSKTTRSGLAGALVALCVSTGHAADRGDVKDSLSSETRTPTQSNSTVSQHERQTAWRDRNDLALVTNGTMTATALLAAHIYGAENEDVGSLSDAVIGPKGHLRGFIVDVGGFLGIGEKPVLVKASEAEIRRDTTSGTLAIFTRFTRDTLEARKAYQPPGR